MHIRYVWCHCCRLRTNKRVRACQVTFIVFVLVFCGLGMLLKTHEEAPRPPLILDVNKLKEPNSSTLVGHRDFRYTINSDVCGQDPVYIIAFVHSTPSHFAARRILRSTWAGVRSVNGQNVRYVFLLGEAASSVQTSLVAESAKYGDLVQGNFIDSYSNLTYKHIMGLKWISEHCNQTHFILKTDEDVFVDTYQLVDFMKTVYGDRAYRTLSCYLIPEGSPTLRRGKWTVPKTEYPYAGYPQYCAGLAYIMSIDLLHEFVLASAYIRFFWIDDVYVTGMLAEALKVRHQSLNLRATLELNELEKWLHSPNASHPCRFIIGNLGDARHWTKHLKDLWVKTLTVHNITKLENGHNLHNSKSRLNPSSKLGNIRLAATRS